MKKVLCIFFCCFFNVVLFSQGLTNSLLDAGINDYNKGQYSFAVNNLRKFIQIAEDNEEKPKAFYFLALSYYFLENYNQALNYINELQTKFRLSSYSIQSQFWRGLISQNKRDWKEAEESFLRYISADPNSELIERAYLAVANSQIEQGKFKEAEDNLRIIITKYKKTDKYEEASVLFSYVLLKNNKNEECYKFLNIWFEKLGKTGEGYSYRDRFWLYLAQIEIDRKNYDRARALLKKIDTFSKNSPSSDIALLQLSKIEEHSENYKEAKEYLLRLANEYPVSKYNTDALLSFAKEEYRNNNFTDALILFKQAFLSADNSLKDTKISSDDKDRLLNMKNSALFYTAEIYYKLGNFQSSIDSYKTVVKTNGFLSVEAAIKLLEIHLETNNLKEAESIIKANDYNLYNSNYKEQYLLIKSRILFLNNDYTNSLKCLSEIKDKNTSIVSVTNLKVNNLIKLNNQSGAIVVLKDAAQFFPFNDKAYLYLNLINIYFSLGNHKDVIENYPLVLTYAKNLNETEKNSLRIKSEYLAALSYMEEKEYDKGIILLKTILTYTDSKNIDKENLQIVYKSFYYIGWLYYKRSDFIEAAKNFGAASLLDIYDDEIIKDSYYMEAISYYSRKDYNSALQKFDTIYKKYYPNDLGIKAYYQMGKCYENLNNRDKTLLIYKKIFEEFPEGEYKRFALYELIVDLLNRKQLEDANKLVKIFTDNYSDFDLYKDVLLLQAQSFLSVERYSEASSLYTFYLKKYADSKNIDVIYYWLSYSSYKIKDYVTAEEYSDILINEYKDSTFYDDCLILLYKIYNEEKKYDKERAIINLLLANEKNLTDRIVYEKRLKEIELILNGTEEIEANLILEADMGNKQAKLDLGLFYFRGRDREKGLKIIKELSETDIELIGARANNILGDIELNNSNYSESQKIFFKTISSYKADSETLSEALYKSGFALYKQDKEGQAKKVFDRLKSNFPNSTWAKRAVEIEKRFKE